VANQWCVDESAVRGESGSSGTSQYQNQFSGHPPPRSIGCVYRWLDSCADSERSIKTACRRQDKGYILGFPEQLYFSEPEKMQTSSVIPSQAAVRRELQ
jgi:hypothetical protein